MKSSTIQNIICINNSYEVSAALLGSEQDLKNRDSSSRVRIQTAYNLCLISLDRDISLFYSKRSSTFGGIFFLMKFYTYPGGDQSEKRNALMNRTDGIGK